MKAANLCCNWGLLALATNLYYHCKFSTFGCKRLTSCSCSSLSLSSTFCCSCPPLPHLHTHTHTHTKHRVRGEGGGCLGKQSACPQDYCLHHILDHQSRHDILLKLLRIVLPTDEKLFIVSTIGSLLQIHNKRCTWHSSSPCIEILKNYI